MSIHESVLAQYEKKSKQSNNNVSSEDRLKKFFNTILPKGETNGEKRIRILPTEDGSTPFKEVMFHEIQVDGKWTKIYDPAQDGKRSPLNDMYEDLKSSSDEESKELSKQFRARKFYIVKIIDRDNESDGPKFWRFKDNYKGDGIFDKIIPIFRTKGDITDINEGRDIILTLSLTSSNNGGKYTAVSSIIPDDKTPLSEDDTTSKSWVHDDTVWSDVYANKSIEYLELVALGKVPKWDNDLKKFVDESEINTVTTIGGGNSTPSDSKEKIKESTVDLQSDDEEDEDLPF